MAFYKQTKTLILPRTMLGTFTSKSLYVLAFPDQVTLIIPQHINKALRPREGAGKISSQRQRKGQSLDRKIRIQILFRGPKMCLLVN